MRKLTAWLIRRDPILAFQAAGFFLAHDMIREQIEDVTEDTGVEPTADQVNEAADGLALSLVNVSLERGYTEAFTRLCNRVERDL